MSCMFSLKFGRGGEERRNPHSLKDRDALMCVCFSGREQNATKQTNEQNQQEKYFLTYPALNSRAEIKIARQVEFFIPALLRWTVRLLH